MCVACSCCLKKQVVSIAPQFVSICIMAAEREYCDKETPHSTDSLVSVAPAKSKRNHAVLIQWLETHYENPYPTKSEKHYLACYANMTQRQLNDWFANARRNIKKIGFAAWKAKHSPALLGSRSRRNLSAAVQAGGQGMIHHLSRCSVHTERWVV